jgi:hypothetical protein
MGVGKYSPLVHDCGPWGDEYRDGSKVDHLGYDTYGYHWKTERDKAGYTERDYLNASISGQDLEDMVLDGHRAPGFDGKGDGNLRIERRKQVIDELETLAEADDIPKHYEGIIYRALELVKDGK